MTNLKFPCLAIYNPALSNDISNTASEFVVLFSEAGLGTVVIPDATNIYKFGEWSHQWAMEMFEPYDKPVILDNTEIQNDA